MWFTFFFLFWQASFVGRDHKSGNLDAVLPSQSPIAICASALFSSKRHPPPTHPVITPRATTKRSALHRPNWGSLSKLAKVCFVQFLSYIVARFWCLILSKSMWSWGREMRGHVSVKTQQLERSVALNCELLLNSCLAACAVVASIIFSLLFKKQQWRNCACFCQKLSSLVIRSPWLAVFCRRSHIDDVRPSICGVCWRFDRSDEFFLCARQHRNDSNRMRFFFLSATLEQRSLAGMVGWLVASVRRRSGLRVVWRSLQYAVADWSNLLPCPKSKPCSDNVTLHFLTRCCGNKWSLDLWM